MATKGKPSRNAPSGRVTPKGVKPAAKAPRSGSDRPGRPGATRPVPKGAGRDDGFNPNSAPTRSTGAKTSHRGDR